MLLHRWKTHILSSPFYLHKGHFKTFSLQIYTHPERLKSHKDFQKNCQKHELICFQSFSHFITLSWWTARNYFLFFFFFLLLTTNVYIHSISIKSFPTDHWDLWACSLWAEAHIYHHLRYVFPWKINILCTQNFKKINFSNIKWTLIYPTA